MRLRAFFFNLLLLVISVSITLLMCEFTIRILYKDQINLFPRYHTDVQYGDFHIRRIISDLEFTHRNIDGNFHFQTNNKGFRNNVDVSYKKNPQVLRIFSVGDSHTQGLEVNQDETFSFVCEKILNKRGAKAEVFNAGVSGFSTAEVLILVENELIKYKPDAIVLGFFENDFIDNVKCGIYKLNDSGLYVSKTEYLPGIKVQNIIYKFKIFHFLGENSYLYAFVFNSVWNYYKDRLKRKNRKTIATEYAIKTVKIDEYQIDLATSLIERLYTVCKQNNIELLIFDIPNIKGQSSIPVAMITTFRNNSDTLYYYEDLKHEFSQMEFIHLPHGNRHISAEVHNLISKKVADYVIRGD